MNLLALLILSLGLAVDTSLAAFTQGSFVRANHLKEALKISLCFAIFQGLMPILGWISANHFYTALKEIDHWVAFVLFSYLGGKLIYDSFQAKEQQRYLNFAKILVLSLATSVDALVAGITLLFLKQSVLLPSLLVGGVTFLSSLLGFWLGYKLKKIRPKEVEIFGGLLLIALGTKILIEHLSQA